MPKRRRRAWRVNSTKWTCPACTFVNTKANFLACEVCNTSKPISASGTSRKLQLNETPRSRRRARVPSTGGCDAEVSWSKIVAGEESSKRCRYQAPLNSSSTSSTVASSTPSVVRACPRTKEKDSAVDIEQAALEAERYRRLADEAHTSMVKKFMEASQASKEFKCGGGCLSRIRAREARGYRRERDRLQKLAREWTFASNNGGQHVDNFDFDSGVTENTVDLHGLSVNEAIDYSSKVLDVARRQRVRRVRLVTGRGTNSLRGPRLLPALLRYFSGRPSNYVVSSDGGALVLRL